MEYELCTCGTACQHLGCKAAAQLCSHQDLGWDVLLAAALCNHNKLLCLGFGEQDSFGACSPGVEVIVRLDDVSRIVGKLHIPKEGVRLPRSHVSHDASARRIVEPMAAAKYMLC